RQKDDELGAIFGLSAAIAGPLDLEQIGAYFVTATRNAVPLEVTIALIVYDDVLEAFRTVATGGPDAGVLGGATYSTAALPALIRTRVIDHHNPLVLADTHANAEPWTKVAQEMPQVAKARSFAALPLVSRERLVGVLLLESAKPGVLTPDNVQVRSEERRVGKERQSARGPER